MNAPAYHLPGVKNTADVVAPTPARALNTGGASDDTGERTVAEGLSAALAGRQSAPARILGRPFP